MTTETIIINKGMYSDNLSIKMIIFAPQKYIKNMIYKQHNRLKNIMSDFPATHNPFNQNLNYEKILRFSIQR
ncbi:hypothetical protein FACS189446_0620 [Bacteroidia bacterium]|nr:hypothetical protein FACS189446_0620 [Bacteroidia bacterium]